MIQWLHRYIYQDLYIPVWPNIVASVLVGGYVILKLKALEKLHHKHHKEIKEKIDAIQDRSGRREL